DPGVGFGHAPFTILTTTGTGVLDPNSQFAQGTTGFIGSHKFNISYVTTPGASKIILTPLLANVTVTFPSPSAPPLLFSQATTTQTVSPAPTVISIPAGLTVVSGQSAVVPVTVSADPSSNVTGFPNGPTGSVTVSLDGVTVTGSPFNLTTPGAGSTAGNLNG